ncbi:MAG: small multi-drug export protein [Patescibacteria group bacterium]|nr:small multi-drug export protein [Patescibacteria group bacterium]
MNLFDVIFHWVSSFPGTVATFLIAGIPSVELSVALPVGVLAFHLPLWQAYLCAVAGSSIPVILVLTLAEPLTRWLCRHSKLAQRFFQWLFHQTREKFYAKYQRHGDLALLLFTAFPLPIPFSGAWSGSLAAWIFGIPPRRAVPLLALGLMIAGGIMVALLVSGSTLLQLFLPDPGKLPAV